ncbi:MAG: hypothetical protein AVDCRST_MAG56-141 [uncultured Cytophagales bacterium]|uniref:Uncharacterized protein n=1 Tax=uncultured Cytophagales bacterium TaxID=158755 RepID=A0A6J4H7S6_9SPHI|nr:MAG: hypothetical protein AVDCRST_MAG56-141 [uncultured Cytophagales bacterium]
MQTMINTLNLRAAKGLVAVALLSFPLLCTSLPAHAQTDHSGTNTPRAGGAVPVPKGATTDKGTYTTQDTVGRKAAGNTGTYGNTRDMQDGKQGTVQDTTRTSTSTQGNRTGTYGNTSTGTGLPLDTTRREGNAYGNSGNTGTRPRQDTTSPSRTGAPSDTIDSSGKGSDERGSRTNDGSPTNGNRTKPTGGKKQ